MRRSASFAACCLTLLLSVHSAHAQSTNLVSRKIAIAAVTNLTAGMTEEAAGKILSECGLASGGAVGCSHGWSRFYALADGSTLSLDVRPKRFRADGAWADGILEGAHIQSNGVEIVTFTLRQSNETESRGPQQPPERDK